MPELPEHEERGVQTYVETQMSEDDPLTLVQKVGTRRVAGRVHELYDVHCENSRWWVISNPMNLYSQDDFPNFDVALTFHIGLAIRIVDRSRTEQGEPGPTTLSAAWRRLTQAVEAMDSATEAADFQGVGLHCREALLALIRDHADADWVGELEHKPKRSDFKGWSAIFAEKLATGYLRAYLKELVSSTWDLAVWLQHYTDATSTDAEIVLEATGHFLTLFAVALRRRDEGKPRRCPNCGSYTIDTDVEVTEDPEPGMLTSEVCRACEWRSERTFESWGDRFEGRDVEAYLGRTTGLTDRLRRRR